MTPAPSTIHQRILRKLLTNLTSYVEEHNFVGSFMCPADVILSMTDVTQPDLVYLSKEGEHVITKKSTAAAPDLIVEVISEHTETIDRTHKRICMSNMM